MKLTIANADLKQVVGCVADYTFGMDLTWDWPCGVAYYGISRAFEVTGEQAYLERMIQWCDEYIDAGLPGWTVNTCSMGHIATLYEQTKEQKYLDIIMSKVDYLENNALRFGDGVLQHTVSAKTIFRSNAGRTPCLWRDISYCAQG